MLVIDASVAVKFVVEEHGSEAAFQLIIGPEPLIAPDWLLVEAASAMWNKVRRSELLETHAEDNLLNLPEFFAQLVPSASLIGAAFQLSFRLRHPVYDCLYLALGIAENVPVVTADRDFVTAARRAGLGHRLRWFDPAATDLP